MKLYILTFALLSNSLLCSAQSVIEQNPEPIELSCVFKFTFKTDSLSSVFHSDNQLLQITKDFSKYESKGQILADSLLGIFSTMQFNQSSANYYIQQRSKIPPYRTTFKVYKLRKAGIIRFFDRITINDYFYDEPNNLFAWNILPVTKNIAGYACQKATTVFAGRSWNVWFTRQVPVSDGPYKFQGLPGLILKAEDSKNNFIFEIINISKPANKVTLSFPATSNAHKTTKNEFRKGREANRKAGFSQMTASGELSVKNSEQVQRQQATKPYNPIELQ